MKKLIYWGDHKRLLLPPAYWLCFTMLVLACGTSKQAVQADALVGSYFTNDFRNYLQSGFTLQSIKPEGAEVYQFTFQENGTIVFQNHAPASDMGRLSIVEGKWEKLPNELYKLILQGSYELEADFKAIATYRLQEEEGLKKLILEQKIQYEPKPATGR